MSRYLRRKPRAYQEWVEEDRGVTADTCIIEDDEPEWTGLYDHNGYELYRDRDRVTFGFVISKSPT